MFEVKGHMGLGHGSLVKVKSLTDLAQPKGHIGRWAHGIVELLHFSSTALSSLVNLPFLKSTYGALVIYH